MRSLFKGMVPTLGREVCAVLDVPGFGCHLRCLHHRHLVFCFCAQVVGACGFFGFNAWWRAQFLRMTAADDTPDTLRPELAGLAGGLAGAMQWTVQLPVRSCMKYEQKQKQKKNWLCNVDCFFWCRFSHGFRDVFRATSSTPLKQRCSRHQCMKCRQFERLFMIFGFVHVNIHCLMIAALVPALATFSPKQLVSVRLI